MKRYFFILAAFLLHVMLNAQSDKTDVLQNLEGNHRAGSKQIQTATLKSASRLFGNKDDLTSVIVVLQAGTVVNVLGSDSTYLRVTSGDDEGYIFRRDASLNYESVTNQANQNQVVSQDNNQQVQPVQDNQENEKSDRMNYLLNKYGSSLAKLLFAGKIWKGMTGDMVKDSWGVPVKINKTFEGSLVREEWEYKNTWLRMENDILTSWGPMNK